MTYVAPNHSLDDRILGMRYSGAEYNCLVFFTNFNISVFFECDDHWYYWDVYVHGLSFATADLGLLNLDGLSTAVGHPWGFCSCLDLILEYEFEDVTMKLFYV